MASFLNITHSNQKKERLPCGNVLTVGRDRSSSLVLQDPMASRHHGMLRMVGEGQYYLLDTGSRNGIYVNSHRMSSPVLLKHDDIIRIGNSELHFDQDNVSPSGGIEGLDCDETMHCLVADIRDIIVLVSDIRGFTTLSESLPITSLTKLMAYWFQEVQRIVEKNGGTVDKFIGDCVLAQWKVKKNSAESFRQSLQATVELNKLSQKISEEFPEINQELRIGVGLNQGKAAVGLGVDNTIMGDVVNTAFRLESMSKELNTDVVINSSFYEQLPGLEKQGKKKKITVKGKVEVLKITRNNFKKLESFLQEN